MADDDHIAQLIKGVAAWNAWRDESPDIRPDLRGADLKGADLGGARLAGADLTNADLRRANLGGDYLLESGVIRAPGRRVDLTNAVLRRANLSMADLTGAALHGAYLDGADLSNAKLWFAQVAGAHLRGANLRNAALIGADLEGADLSGARLIAANLSVANLSGAKLSEADLNEANLRNANLSNAYLVGANLQTAALVETDLTGADLTGCRIFGISAWGLKLEKAKQQNLVITRENEPEITVDNIEVAQFIYLMLHNHKIRDVINSITSKAVLILGRFTDQRKAVLDALREELRKRDYLPILFDFEKPRSRDTDETITLLARMAKFVIADISDAKAVLQELRAIVPDLPSLPVQPIILTTQEEPGMFDFYRNRPSFLTVHRYPDQDQLLADLGDKVIRPAELKVLELRG